jgi:hypothetical protein
VTAFDQPPDRGSHAAELPAATAAAALGLTREALRSRIRRGLIPARRVGGRWVVTLTGLDRLDAGHDAGQPDRFDHPDHPAEGEPTAAPASQVAALERERDFWRAEVDRRDAIRSDELRYLRERLVAAEQGQAELRRMLNLEQQTVAALRALPAAREDVPTRAEEPESGRIVAEAAQDGVAAESLQALKDADVKGKKQRRRLLARLAAAWRGE